MSPGPDPEEGSRQKPASARIAAVDLNGILRGKRIPRAKLENPARMPLSALNVDIFGHDIEDSPLVFESGDADGALRPADRPRVPLPWLADAPPLALCEMYEDKETPFDGDPRQALARVIAQFSARGWRPRCAVEIEFYLVEAEGALAAPRVPRTQRRAKSPQVLGLQHLDGFEAFFNDIETGAASMGLAPATITSESGLGQFEITLDHAEAMNAADDALFMKELIRGTAQNHGLTATFLAKPFPDEPGSGLHVHASLMNEEGRNLFDDGGPSGTPLLRQAVAGILRAMPASTLIFAPHLASFARFVDHAHAPTGASWGYDNRTVALRIPSGPPPARRFEHRVAGADANPYLLFAAILGAAFSGLAASQEPPEPLAGNAYGQACPSLCPDMAAAIDALRDPVMLEFFAPRLLDNLARTKAQELRKCAALSQSDLTQALLEVV